MVTVWNGSVVLWWIVWMYWNQQEKKTLTLIVFGDFVPYSGAKTAVPQRTLVTLNSLHRLRPPSFAGQLQICCKWRRHGICHWLAVDAATALDPAVTLASSADCVGLALILDRHSLHVGTLACSFPLMRKMYCYWEAAADLESSCQSEFWSLCAWIGHKNSKHNRCKNS